LCLVFLLAIALPAPMVGAATGPHDTLAATTLDGEGSTLQLHYTQAVISAFKRHHPAVRITYQGLGSPRGLDDLTAGRIDFAGTDRTDLAPAGANVVDNPLLYFPLAAAPIVVAYNVPGVGGLHLSAGTIAEIFQGQITTWDDPAIQAENPDASLPTLPVIVAHRSDGSATTENFAAFLAAAAPTLWTGGTGTTVQWPVGSQGGAGNSGVAQIVKTAIGAVGYVDFPDAKALGLAFASVENAVGTFVAPSADAAAAALDGLPIAADLTFDPINAIGKDAYPITAPTWLVVATRQPDHAKSSALKALLRFVYADGQQIAASTMYAPLPKPIVRSARAQIRAIVPPL
jgi:phosphate transport system substrate-binding protein